MGTTFAALLDPPRPFRPVTLPAGLAVHVRDLTLAELRRIDALAEEVRAGETRNERYLLLLGVYCLAEPDGEPCFPNAVRRSPIAPESDAVNAALDVVAGLTIEQIQALGKEALPDKDAAKNA